LSCLNQLQELGGSSQIDEGFLWNGGKPRLSRARMLFLNDQTVDEKGVLGLYRSWREFDEYLILYRREALDSGDVSQKFVAVKCSKRGNDVYRRRVRARLGGLSLKKDVVFFHKKDRDRSTGVIFFTLTYDAKRCSLEEAWVNVGSDFNRWITGLREKYGQLSFHRTFEAYETGYPHVHGMIVFKDHRFSVFPVYKDGEEIWRIDEKAEFEKWHSFVDVRAVRTYSAVLRYLEKRILDGTDKAGNKDEGDFTLAMLWMFRKRSFSVSRDFQAVIKAKIDLIRTLHNSKLLGVLVGAKSLLSQKWYCLGVAGGGLLGLDGAIWACEVEKDVVTRLIDLGVLHEPRESKGSRFSGGNPYLMCGQAGWKYPHP
jgi:hypothetical protein